MRSSRRATTPSCIAGSKSRYPFLPSRLAMYIAASASRMSSSALRCVARPEDRDADAPAQRHLAQAGLHRAREQLEDPLRPRRRPPGSRRRPRAARANSSPPNRAAMSAPRTLVVQPPRELDQHLVARRVAEAVVDGLEVVEVEEDHRRRPAVAPAAGDRLPHLLGEHRAVGEPGDGIVERLVGELRLERLALADVAALSRIPPTCSSSIRSVYRISNWRTLAVAVGQRALERLDPLAGGGHRRRSARAARDRRRPRAGRSAAHEIVGDVAEHALDRRALVADRACRARGR